MVVLTPTIGRETMNTLTTLESAANLPIVFTESLELARDFAKAARSVATQRAYRGDMAIFVEWCRSRGLIPLPASAEVVSAFLADQAALGKRPSTVGRRLAAIRYFHGYMMRGSPKAFDARSREFSMQRALAILEGLRSTARPFAAA
jgi:site-specific recombinase XerD